MADPDVAAGRRLASPASTAFAVEPVVPSVFRTSAKEVEHERVERVGLFPMRLMAGVADQMRFRIGESCGDGLQYFRREQVVVFAGYEKNRHTSRGERCECDLVHLGRWRKPRALRAFLDLDPASSAFGVRVPIN